MSWRKWGNIFPKILKVAHVNCTEPQEKSASWEDFGGEMFDLLCMSEDLIIRL